MKTAPLRSIALCLLGLALSPGALAQAAHAHGHEASAAQATAAPSAGRHATDAALRAGMTGIRAAVDGLGHYEQGHMGPEQAMLLADTVQERVGFLVANCKLEPEADQALHGVIGKLMQGVGTLKADPKDFSGIAKMREALADYDRLFVDPA